MKFPLNTREKNCADDRVTHFRKNIYDDLIIGLSRYTCRGKFISSYLLIEGERHVLKVDLVWQNNLCIHNYLSYAEEVIAIIMKLYGYCLHTNHQP